MKVCAHSRSALPDDVQSLARHSRELEATMSITGRLQHISFWCKTG